MAFSIEYRSIVEANSQFDLINKRSRMRVISLSGPAGTVMYYCHSNTYGDFVQELVSQYDSTRVEKTLFYLKNLGLPGLIRSQEGSWVGTEVERHTVAGYFKATLIERPNFGLRLIKSLIK